MNFVWWQLASALALLAGGGYAITHPTELWAGLVMFTLMLSLIISAVAAVAD